jgi:uncharacterized damage-inducible protein DinB
MEKIMRTLENFRAFLPFDNWANDAILQALKNSAHSNEKAVEIFGHLLLAENEWLMRMTGEHADSTNFNFWSIETLADCEKAFASGSLFISGLVSWNHNC